MAYYRKNCPYCGHFIEGGGNRPLKRFGNPKKQCFHCGKTYRDSDTIDWLTASLWEKFLFCLANGRFILCIIPPMLFLTSMDTREWWMFLVFFLLLFLSFALCVAYVKLRVRLYYGRMKEINKKHKSKNIYKKYQNGLFHNNKSDNSNRK